VRFSGFSFTREPGTIYRQSSGRNAARCPLLPEKWVCREVGFKMDIFGNGKDL